MSARKVRALHEELPQARLVRAVLLQRGWTDQQLASELGVGRSTVTCWKDSLRDVHPTWVQLIRSLLVQ